MAVTSLVLGILSLLGMAILILPSILAIVLGHVAYGKCKKENLGGAGLAIGGFVTGYLSFFSIFVFGLLAAMAIPAFEKVREQSREAAVVNNLRVCASAGQQFILETGDESVTVNELVEEQFMPSLPPTIFQETYADLVIYEMGGELVIPAEDAGTEEDVVLEY